mgnify:CR=1 FL=1
MIQRIGKNILSAVPHKFLSKISWLKIYGAWHIVNLLMNWNFGTLSCWRLMSPIDRARKSTANLRKSNLKNDFSSLGITCNVTHETWTKSCSEYCSIFAVCGNLIIRTYSNNAERYDIEVRSCFNNFDPAVPKTYYHTPTVIYGIYNCYIKSR